MPIGFQPSVDALGGITDMQPRLPTQPEQPKQFTAPDVSGLSPEAQKRYKNYQSMVMPGMQEELRLGAEQDRLDAEEKAATAGFKAERDAAVAKKEKEVYANIQAQYDLVKDSRKKIENTKFIPTQETAQDFANFFGLMGIIGFAIGAGGKGRAIQAMSAMNGMLEGHRAGREDLYKKEKATFEENFKALKLQNEAIQVAFKDYLEMASKNLEIATRELDAKLSAQGADFLKERLKKAGSVQNQIKIIQAQNKLIQEAVKFEMEQQRKLEERREKANLLEKEYELRKKLLDYKLAHTPQKAPAAMKKGEYQAKAVSDAIGKQVDPQAANVLTSGAEYIRNLEDLQQQNLKLGNKPGLTVKLADNVNQFLQSRARSSPDGRITQQDLIDASKAMEQTKDFSSLSDDSKILAKKELNAIMTNLQLKYGNRAPVAEFRAAQKVLSRGSMTATAYNTVMQNEIKSAKERLAASGFTAKDLKAWENSIQGAFPEDSGDEEDSSVSPAPANAPRTGTFNGRPIIVKNGKWVYQDTGEEAK